MKYTKERFKELWEADENGSGITHEVNESRKNEL